jgi:hypothetical protein
MLYIFNGKTKKEITELPHYVMNNYNAWSKNLSVADLTKVYKAFDEIFDAAVANSEKSIVTAGWVPGNDWTNTPYYPLYVACGKNKEASGLFFGLLMFKYVMEEREENWILYNNIQVNGRDIKSNTYILDKI